jgi:hypothetical protein
MVVVVLARIELETFEQLLSWIQDYERKTTPQIHTLHKIQSNIFWYHHPFIITLVGFMVELEANAIIGFIILCIMYILFMPK